MKLHQNITSNKHYTDRYMAIKYIFKLTIMDRNNKPVVALQ